MIDVIIIGAGIAGVTSAIYAKRKGLNVLVLEKECIGGILKNITTIKNYPGYESIEGPELALILAKQLKDYNIEIKYEEVVKLENNDVKKVITNKGEYEAKNVIIATGRKPKYLGLDNEKDYLGKGVSTCASCDGFLYKNEDVAVVGSGNSALSESLYLSNVAKTVYFLHRKETFTGDEELVNKIKEKENIKIIGGVTVSKINEENGKIESILLDNGKEIKVKGIFIYIGYKPDTEIFKSLDILNDNGDIIVNSSCETKLKGIYAVGDCNKKDLYQLVTAASDGAVAASDID